MPEHWQQMTVRGNQIPYFRIGQGEPLLYLHGLLGDLFSFHGDVLPFHTALAERFEVIAPAHLGYADASGYLELVDSIEDLVLYHLDVLEALGLDQVHLVGHSLGGWVAAELAVRCAHVLKSLVLISPCGLNVPESPIGDFFYAAAPRPAGDRQPLRNMLFAEPTGELANQLLPDPAQGVPPDEQQMWIHRALVTAARVGWSPPYLYSMSLLRRLPRIPTGTLVVWGENDGLVPIAHGRAYEAGIPAARLKVVPGGGHCLVSEHPQATAADVLAFLQEIS